MRNAAYLAIPVLAVAAVTTVIIQNKRAPAARILPKGAHSYLFPRKVPDSLALLPPPPAANSDAMNRDIVARDAALKLKGTPRYRLAASDANRDDRNAMQAFDCALGVDIDPERMPTLVRLLASMRIDVRSSAYKAKARYNRPMPYVANHGTTCLPEAEQLDAGSYPSAGAALGWAYAHILARLNPARQQLIVQRGQSFGDSRLVCDASWESDVEAGRKVGDEVVKRLLADPAFEADLANARKEVATALRTGSMPSTRCQDEATTLAVR